MKIKTSVASMRVAVLAGLTIVVVGAITGLTFMSQTDAASSGQPSAFTQSADPEFRVADSTAQTASVSPATVGFSSGTVTVTRSASVAIEPDHAVLNLGVEAIASTVAAARQTAATRMAAVIDAVKEAGLEDDDIETTMFEIAPQTEWVETEIELANGESVRSSRSRVIAYSVRNGIAATVRDLDSVGDVIDAAAEAGGDTFRVPQIRFAASNRAVASDQARQLAAADAKRVAELYATSLGFILGPVVEMTEYGTGPAIEASSDAVAESSFAARTPIIPGDIDVSATVQVSFAILGARQQVGQ